MGPAEIQEEGFSPIPYDNLYLKAAIEAAEKEQVNVKILLSSLYAYSDDPRLDNYDTFLYINDYAQNHNLTEFLEARLVDFDRLGLAKVHNKGMVVDGKWTLISSINWNRNSVAQNREVGVIIENEAVAQYFTEIFYWDFNEPPESNVGEDLFVGHGSNILFLDRSEDSDDNITVKSIKNFWYIINFLLPIKVNLKYYVLCINSKVITSTFIIESLFTVTKDTWKHCRIEVSIL